MNTKHTPGPWITSTGRVPGIGRSFGVLKESHKPGEKGESICVVCKEDNMQPHDIANADLIAAAPDLLTALRKCWGWTHRAMELEVSGSMVCAQTDDAAEALAALTKALGPDWQNK